MKTLLVPPGGFAGVAQMTPAMQYAFSKVARQALTSGVRRVARKTVRRATSSVKKRRSKRRTSSTKSRLVKGSAAAKRYMAKIRKLRK